MIFYHHISLKISLPVQYIIIHLGLFLILCLIKILDDDVDGGDVL